MVDFPRAIMCQNFLKNALFQKIKKILSHQFRRVELFRQISSCCDELLSHLRIFWALLSKIFHVSLYFVPFE